MQESTATEDETPGAGNANEWFVPRLDLLLVVAVVALSPLLWLFVQDIWVRSVYRYFLFVPLLSLGFGVLRGGLLQNRWPQRSLWSMILFGASAVLGLTGAWLLSPWLGLVAGILVLTAWLLERNGGLSWYENVGLLSPVWLLLLLPTTAASDPALQLQPWVVESTSNVLDLSGVPHLASPLKIDIRSGIVPVSSVLTGIDSPYWLLAGGCLLCLLLRPSLLVCGLTWLTVPIWSWFAKTLHLSIGIWLVDQFDIAIFGGSRNTLVSVGLLGLQVLFLWLQMVGLRKLLAPLEGYGEGAENIQKLFNQIVVWPAKDPLRSGRATDPTGNLRDNRSFLYTAFASGVSLVVAGGLASYLMNRGIGFTGLMQHWSTAKQLTATLTADSLPSDLIGVKQGTFEASGATGEETNLARWSFANPRQLITLTVQAPYRGFFPAELDAVNSGYRIKSEAQVFDPGGDALPTEGLPQGALFQEFISEDPVYGESYVGYTSITLAPELSHQPPIDFISRLPLAPTTISVQVAADNAEGLRDEDRVQLRALLVSAAAIIARKAGTP